jgi:hypothetical protein
MIGELKMKTKFLTYAATTALVVGLSSASLAGGPNGVDCSGALGGAQNFGQLVKTTTDGWGGEENRGQSLKGEDLTGPDKTGNVGVANQADIDGCVSGNTSGVIGATNGNSAKFNP